MSDFSIELAAERIHNERTREYFREILSSYVSNNNRSAVVMLWSVAVCDIIYKLQELRDVFNDEKAKKILEDIEDKQSQNSNTPSWEIDLIHEVKKQTKFLDNAEYENLLHLQKNDISVHIRY